MGWELGFLTAASDLEITHQEVTGMMTDMVNAVIQGMMMIAIMSMFVKQFYDILGPKKYAKEREEMLERVGDIW